MFPEKTVMPYAELHTSSRLSLPPKCQTHELCLGVQLWQQQQQQANRAGRALAQPAGDEMFSPEWVKESGSPAAGEPADSNPLQGKWSAADWKILNSSPSNCNCERNNYANDAFLMDKQGQKSKVDAFQSLQRKKHSNCHYELWTILQSHLSIKYHVGTCSCRPSKTEGVTKGSSEGSCAMLIVPAVEKCHIKAKTQVIWLPC